MSTTPPPLFATWLGYLTVFLAFGAATGAVAAWITRRQDLDRLAHRLTIATAISVAATTMVALSVHVLSWASGAIYAQVFLAASLFTLAVSLADWRSRVADVLWKGGTWLLYSAGQVACLGLAIALVWMG